MRRVRHIAAWRRLTDGIMAATPVRSRSIPSLPGRKRVMTDARILYVHGAGNRAEQAEAYGVLMRKRLGLEQTPERLIVSDWGVRHGTDDRLLMMDQALPDYPEQALRIGAAAPREAVLSDALAPLRAMSAPATAGAPAMAAAAPSGTRDADQLLAFLALGGFDLTARGLPADQISAAAREVAASPEYAAARGDPVALVDATATSVLARAVERDPAAPARAGIAGLDLGWLTDRVGDLAAVLVGSGIVGAVEAWVAPQLLPALSLWASKKLAPHRHQFMHDHMLVIADVLRYQRHGDEIRAYVRDEIRALSKPRLVVAHSLGGIISVDALFGPDAPSDLDVSLLVTFGSQSAMLSSIDALDIVTPTIPWLNLWATYDFVSFLDAKLWPGAVDHQLEIEVGFPAAHGSYYDSDEFGRLIRTHPAAAGVFA
jgi:hypothetical protein